MEKDNLDRTGIVPSQKEPKQKRSAQEQIAMVASEIALKKFLELKKRDDGEQRDKRLRNTKLLLRNYRNFVDYNDNAIYETAQLCGDEDVQLFEMLGINTSETHRVESIRNNVVKTRVMMEHIQEMLDVYEKRCEKSKKPEVQRRWRVLHCMYLSEERKEPQDVAATENISISQVYQDINNASEDLSKLFFGLQLSQFYE